MLRVPEAFRLLYAKRQSLVKPGLERVKEACSLLGGLAHATPSVVIGGTNGKGSTAGMLWRLYAAKGERVGLFTSPHLISFSERIRITDIDVSEDLIERELSLIQRSLPAELYDEMTFFELTTVLALKIFKDADCALNILEVGLGGRLDSTNIGDPLATAVVSIGMDHGNLLGHTPALIASEKCGIFRPGVPVFWGGKSAGAAEADAVIREEAALMGAKLLEGGVDFSWEKSSATAPNLVKTGSAYLRDNFALAEAMMLEIQLQRGSALTTAAADVKKALIAYDQPDLPWPPTLLGRFQMIQTRFVRGDAPMSQPLLLDVCHNVDGAIAFVKALRERFGPQVKLPGLVSMMRDKDTAGIIDILQGVLAPLVLFRNENERSAYYENDFAAAWKKAAEHFPISAHFPWVVCGSVMAVGEVFAYLGEHKIATDGNPAKMR